MESSVIDLSGHSGFEVRLFEKSPGKYLVQKKTKSISQNPRLKTQYQKQQFFLQLKQDLFYVPKILRAGWQKNLFFFEYEYVEGVTLLHFIENEPVGKIIKVLDALVEIIKYFNQNSGHYEKPAVGIMLAAALEKKIVSNLEHHPNPAGLKKYLSAQVKAMPDNFQKTICHGDLTFDNIIVDKQGNLWLIDFLELFYPHYWFDVAKLFQDIDGHWYEFKYNLRLPHNKLNFVREYFLARVGEFDPEYIKHHNLLLASVLLRILPYLKTEQEKQFILEKLDYFTKL